MQLMGDSVPHVSMCKEALFDPLDDCYNIVMPYYTGGDIFDRLQQASMTEDEIRPLFKNIMQALRGMHDKDICHHDLSIENIMLNDGQAYIIDFGMAVRVPVKVARRCLIKPQGNFGKLPYMSPEVYKSNVPFSGEAVDVWSAGTILFCMVTRQASYGRPQESDPQFQWMTTDMAQLMHSWNLDLSPEVVHLMANMLQTNPSLRLTIDEVLHHPWMMM